MPRTFIMLLIALLIGSLTPSSSHAEVGPRGSTTFNCGTTRASLDASSAARATLGLTTVFAGYRQVSSNNQNPILSAFIGNAQQWCRDDYDTSGADARAYGVVAANGFLYAVFTADGGNVGLRDFTGAGWISSYGMGGGPSVSVVLRIDASNGDPTGGTFIIAKLMSGNTNSAFVRDVTAFGDNIAIRGDSAFGPLNINRNRNLNCSANEFTYILSPDLGDALVTWCPDSSTGSGGAAGDCNLDGGVDAGDVAASLLPLVRDGKLVTTGCDANGNGSTAAGDDLACLRDRIFGLAGAC